MKKNISKIFFLLVLGFLLSAHLPPGEVTASEVNTTGVKVMQKERLGKFLADGQGMTLYSFSRDEKSISNCIEGCAVNWPPFYVDPSAVIEGCESSDFAAITRTDGRQQTTYQGMPLYYFKNDRYPGDTYGHGIGDVWFLVTP